MSGPEPRDDEVQYLEAEPMGPGEAPMQPPRTVSISYSGRTGGVPCCSACGCLAIAIALLVLFNLGSVISTLIVVIAAAWVGGMLLRMLGVSKSSTGYVILLIPTFLIVANVLAKLLRGEYAYSWREVVLGTLAIYAFLWLMASLARGRRLR
jgi:hypothetical protein